MFLIGPFDTGLDTPAGEVPGSAVRGDGHRSKERRPSGDRRKVWLPKAPVHFACSASREGGRTARTAHHEREIPDQEMLPP